MTHYSISFELAILNSEIGGKVSESLIFAISLKVNGYTKFYLISYNHLKALHLMIRFGSFKAKILIRISLQKYKQFGTKNNFLRTVSSRVIMGIEIQTKREQSWLKIISSTFHTFLK